MLQEPLIFLRYMATLLKSSKFFLFFVFLFVFLVVVGLVKIAFPVLVVVGIISLFVPKTGY